MLIVAEFHHLIERRLVVAAVEHIAAAGADGLVKGRQVVTAADFGRVKAKLSGEAIHAAFDEVDALRPSRAAVRALRRLVRVRVVYLKLHVGDVVDAGGDHGGGGGQLRLRALGICAEIVQVTHTEAGDLALGVRGNLKIGCLATSLVHRKKILGAGGDPLDGDAKLFGCDA